MYYIIIFAFVSIAMAGTCGQTCCEDLPKRPSMTFYYYINTGRFIGGSGDSTINTFGYSGSGKVQLIFYIKYRNDPSGQCIKNKGPAPSNIYKILTCQNTMHSPPVDRPCSFWIDSDDQEKMCGRTEIMIHGCACCTPSDWSVPPVEGCSEGCIIINEENRKKLRVGDTLIVQDYDPLGQVDDGTFLQNDEGIFQ